MVRRVVARSDNHAALKPTRFQGRFCLPAHRSAVTPLAVRPGVPDTYFTARRIP